MLNVYFKQPNGRYLNLRKHNICLFCNHLVVTVVDGAQPDRYLVSN